MPPIEYAVIASGFAISGDIDLRKHALAAIFCPSITSGDLLMQGASAQVSADFVRLLDTRGQGSGDLRFATGLGSREVPWPWAVRQPAYARVELGVAQTAPRTLTLITRPR